MSFLRLLESARSPVLTCFFRFCTLFGEEMIDPRRNLLCFLVHPTKTWLTG